MREPIVVYRYYDAPDELQISKNGGDEDWLAVLPPDYENEDILWLECGHFGVCCVDYYPHPTKDGYQLAIGSHA